MKIVILDKIELPKQHLDAIKVLGDVTVYDDFPETEQEVIRRTNAAEIITANWVEITPKIIDSAKRLKFIIVPAVGYDSVDVRYAARKHIRVLNCPTHSSAAVANLAIGFMFGLTRKVKTANNSLESGKWARSAFRGTELSGKTLVLLGHGNTGKRVENIAKLLGMDVKYADSKTPQNEIDELIKIADIVSLHLPLTDKTKGIMSERRLKLMKNGAYLINVSRGGLVNQKALIEALKSKHLGGAGLDVFANEPSSESADNISSDVITLSRMNNVIATPHMAFNTEETIERLGEELMRDIESCVSGKPINVVND